MGGNIWVDNRRLSKEEYQDFLYKVLDKFIEYPHVVMEIPSYRMKPSFGDIDFIVDPEVTTELLEEIFHDCPITQNSNITSVQFEKVQLDFIRTTRDQQENSLRYFSYNDLGNLLGRVTRQYGFKLGFRGLHYVLRRGNEPVRDIPVNISFYETLDLFGYNWSSHCDGFRKLEDIFKYVVSSPLVSSEIFNLENLDSDNRTRNKKRKTYNLFLQWLKVHPITNVPTMTSEQMLERVIDAAPGLKVSIDREIELSNIRLAAKNVFNASVVMEVTGLEKQALGEFMKGFKDKYSVQARSTWSKEEAINLILQHQKEIK